MGGRWEEGDELAHLLTELLNLNLSSVWDLESGKLKATLEGHEWAVNSVYVTPNGRQIISASADETVR